MAGRAKPSEEPSLAKAPARVHVPRSPRANAFYAPDGAARPVIRRVPGSEPPGRPPVVGPPMPRAPVTRAALGRVPAGHRAALEVIAPSGVVIAAVARRVLPPPRRPRVALIVHARKATGTPEEGLGSERDGRGHVRERQPPLIAKGQPLASAEPSATGGAAALKGRGAPVPRGEPPPRLPRFCGPSPVVGPAPVEGT